MQKKKKNPASLKVWMLHYHKAEFLNFVSTLKKQNLLALNM